MQNDEFKDYYEIMELNPNAVQQTIEKVFRLLAKRYHPDNLHTGDTERFSLLTEAYQVLSDPAKRAAYDAGYDNVRSLKSKIRTQVFEAGHISDDKQIRHGILSILYLARRRNARNPGVGIVYLEQVLECLEEQIEFHLWYLKEKGWIQRTDTGMFAITAGGVDAVEEQDLLLRKDRLLEGPATLPGDGESAGTVDSDSQHLIETGSPRN